MAAGSREKGSRPNWPILEDTLIRDPRIICCSWSNDFPLSPSMAMHAINLSRRRCTVCSNIIINNNVDNSGDTICTACSDDSSQQQQQQQISKTKQHNKRTKDTKILDDSDCQFDDCLSPCQSISSSSSSNPPTPPPRQSSNDGSTTSRCTNNTLINEETLSFTG